MLVSAYQSFSCPWPVTGLETTHQRRNLALERISGFHVLWSAAIGFIEKSSIYYQDTQGTEDKSRLNYRVSCLDWVAVAMGAFSLFNRIALSGNQSLCHWLICMAFCLYWLNKQLFPRQLLKMFMWWFVAVARRLPLFMCMITCCHNCFFKFLSPIYLESPPFEIDFILQKYE